MSKCPHRKYVIFSTSETGSINYSEVMETTGSTLRLNRSGSLTFVKYDRPSGSYIPDSVAALETRVENTSPANSNPSYWELDGYKYEYTYAQIQTILATDEWSSSGE